ncbi:DUF5372 family protein, partial [Sphingomonas oligophenolica]
SQATGDTAKIEGLIPHVTVTCPRHPLFGERFEVLAPESDRGPAWVTIKVAHGGRRNILRAVTDLATAPPDSKIAPLVSGLVLIRVVALAEALRRNLEEVECEDGREPTENTAEGRCVGEPVASEPTPTGSDFSPGSLRRPGGLPRS